MMRFGEGERAQEKFYAIKGPTKIWDVNMLIIKLSQNWLKQKLLSISLDI